MQEEKIKIANKSIFPLGYVRELLLYIHKTFLAVTY